MEKRNLGILIGCLLLGGCVAEERPVAPPTVIVKTVCPDPVIYTKEDQILLRDEIITYGPQTPETQKWLLDYAAQRKACRDLEHKGL